MNMDHPTQWPHFSNTPSEQSEREAPAPRLTLFAYGTLKSGQKNHKYFCGNATRIQPATTVGRLYALPVGYPALEVPEEHILTHGSADPLADAVVQSCISSDLGNMPTPLRPFGDWDQVHGEIITFTDPLRSLPPIDRLEGFHPGRPSLYQRILLPVFSGPKVHVCWAYIMPRCSEHRRLRDGIWRPDRS